ncbi:protein containing DUF1446 [Rhodopirellula maiorica SM1]|uniref:Protein containing DUF1446 n=1 Tax=Rhodopirellula maiorica SM1 TaxID=1265738 RepID=M5S2M5_9BACT|nr:acyclic terpene utilization AtuA family protein [Rhodopirellula maiorica]EMI21882.1 protein containing DUF1446 [Rhodopirellula maiorica SM1]
MVRPIRIGNAQAFWGDRNTAAAELLAREPELDFLTLDYLAEVSMSILATQQQRDPKLGFARDFLDVVQSLVPYWAAGGKCRLIANAGGLNPIGCARACRQVIQDAGCPSLRIGIVSGDDVLSILRSKEHRNDAESFRNLDSGDSIDGVADRLVTGNAYLGATAIVDALAQHADIVITGRVADPSMVVAACVHHFSWTEADLDCLAGATVAGHLIECGTQVTGGISTEWMTVHDPVHLGFPIVEISDDGTCIVTKPRCSGGEVTPWTVKEQLVYEIGDSEAYLSPDVTVSFRDLCVDEIAPNRVRVRDAIGKPAPSQYKVSATFRDGFRSSGMLTIVGRSAKEKAQRAGKIVLERLRDADVHVRNSLIECLGCGACAEGFTGSTAFIDTSSLGEVVLRVAVEVDSQKDAERFSRELMPLVTAGPQGTTGYAEGRPRVHPVIRYWPCLISRDLVHATVESLQTKATDDDAKTAKNWPPALAVPTTDAPTPEHLHSEEKAIPTHAAIDDSAAGHLYDIAIARSGDKGTGANIGVIARDDIAWGFLHKWLTSERVAAFFCNRELQSVQRFELPNLHALNFVIHGILQQRLRTDAQGKTLGQILLEMPLPKSAPHSCVSIGGDNQHAELDT